jgi:hypothetical protein
LCERIGEVLESIPLTDLDGVIPSLPARTVLGETSRLFNAQLSCEKENYARRSLCQVFRKSPQESGRAQLNGKAQPVAITAMQRDEIVVSIIQMEMSRELFG